VTVNKYSKTNFTLITNVTSTEKQEGEVSNKQESCAM